MHDIFCGGAPGGGGGTENLWGGGGARAPRPPVATPLTMREPVFMGSMITDT